MKRTLSSTGRAVALIGVFIAISVSTIAQQRQQQTRDERLPNASAPSAPKAAKFDRIAGKLKVSDPKSHANLTIFLIEGEDRMDTSNVLTLSEALQKKGRVIVKETGDVNELTVRNKDPKHTVFIMAGDIVKGGQQDRTLGTDLPLITTAGTVPVTSFCVEQGRWHARGKEDVGAFSSAGNVVATKDAKVALRSKKEQGEVWKSVAKAQEKISAGVGKPVAAATSPTSLQLSLEDKELKKKNETFITGLKGSVEENARAIGFVCVINGQINSAEIFAGHDLFRRAWPRLLEAAATEAISEQKEKVAHETVSVEQAKDFLAAAEDTKATKEQIHGSFWNVSGENETTLTFQTIDEAMDGRWLRRSIIKK